MKKIILFLSSLFLLSSCSNIFNSLSGTSKNENEYKVTVFVQNEAQSEARSAFPVFKENANISFGIAYYPTEEGSSSRNKKFLPFDYTAGPIDVSLSPGNWTVYSYRFDGDLLETCFESDPVDIVLTTENPSTSVKLIEKPKFQRNDENRIENAVNLPIKVCSDINQIKATWERNGQVYSTTGGKDASGMYYLDLIEYGAPYPYNGTYNVKFDFYGTGSPAPLLYSVMEVVTVYPYCTTTTWTPAASGLEYFSQDASGNWIMDITTPCISKYKLSTFYVDPSATTNNDNPTGDYFAPFTTLEAAVTAANNNTTASECTINIRKGQICELESAVTVNGNVTITSYSKNANDDLSTTPAPIIKKTVAFNNPMITASSTSGKTLTLNGITIDGDNKTINKNGGGINIPSGGSLSITNTTIQNCKAANGAGIYCEGTITFGDTGKVEIKGNTVSSSGLGSGIYYLNSATALTLNSTVDTQDIYFGLNSKLLKLSSNITNTIPVRFNLVPFNNTKQVLSNSSATDYVASSFSKFTVSHSSESWFIDPDGYLTQTKSIMANSSAPTSGAYGVSTSKEITKIKEWVNAGSTLSGVTLKLTKDITMPTLPSNEYFEGIGLSNKPFKGTFDGDGKSIKGLKVKYGLFGTIETGATIKNLTIEGTGQRGALVNSMNGGTIDTCTNKLIITAPNESGIYENYGGIVNTISSGTIQNCTNIGTISGGNIAANGNSSGGIAGYVNLSTSTVTIKNCTNTGSITRENYAAGIVGFVFHRDDATGTCTISDCTNSGNITAEQYAAGIVANNRSQSTITGCANTGNVTSTSFYVGGIVAFNLGTIRNSYNTGTVKATSSTTGQYVGGIVGYLGNDDYPNPKVLNCYNLGDVSGQMRVGGIVGNIRPDSVFIQNCVVKSSVTSTGSNKGKIFGYFYHASSGDPSNIQNNYFYDDSGSPSIENGCGNSEEKFNGKIYYFTYNSNSYKLGSAIPLPGGVPGTSNDLQTLVGRWVQIQNTGNPGLYKQWAISGTTISFVTD